MLTVLVKFRREHFILGLMPPFEMYMYGNAAPIMGIHYTLFHQVDLNVT